MASCASTGATTNTASQVNCEDVSHNLDTAKEELAKAQSELENSKDSPDEKEKQDTVNARQKTVEDLETRSNECKTQGETPSSEAPSGDSTTVPPTDEQPQCSVTLDDGSSVELPAVGACSPDAATPAGPIASNTDPRTPPVNHGPLLNSWCDLKVRFDAPDYQWYRDGVQRTAGVSWEQVGNYCELEKSQNVDLRGIVVFGGNPISDDDARAMVAADGVPHADRLQVFRQYGLVNTRGMEVHQMNEFYDGRSMVRVSLLPPIQDADGKVVSVDSSRGVFIDCTNAWRVPKEVRPVCKVDCGSTPQTPTCTGCNPPPPVTSPPTTGPPCTRGCTTTTVTPTTAPPPTTPPTTTCPTGKCTPPTTTAPPPTTSPPPPGVTTTTQAPPPVTVTTPTTMTPPVTTVPNTTPPTSRVEY